MSSATDTTKGLREEIRELEKEVSGLHVNLKASVHREKVAMRALEILSKSFCQSPTNSRLKAMKSAKDELTLEQAEKEISKK
jgi:hypothetical protein